MFQRLKSKSPPLLPEKDPLDILVSPHVLKDDVPDVKIVVPSAPSEGEPDTTVTPPPIAESLTPLDTAFTRLISKDPELIVVPTLDKIYFLSILVLQYFLSRTLCYQ